MNFIISLCSSVFRSLITENNNHTCRSKMRAPYLWWIQLFVLGNYLVVITTKTTILLPAAAAAATTKTTTSLSSRMNSPVINWDSSWTASSVQGTVITVPCISKDHDINNTSNTALLVVLQQQQQQRTSSSSSSITTTTPYTLLDRAFVVWTGFAVDVEFLTNQLLQSTDDRIATYNQGLPHVAAFLASCIRQEAMHTSGRPYAVQALVVQRQRVWTIDPSGSCTQWNTGATALGRDAVDVRKRLFAALKQQKTMAPTVTEALQIAREALPNDETRKYITQAFLLYEHGPKADTLAVQTIDTELVPDDLQLASNGNSSSNTSSNNHNNHNSDEM